MNKATYRALRHELRLAQDKLTSNLRQEDMADGRLMVQITAQQELVVRLRARIFAISQQLPNGTDPLGFRAMYRDWKWRRQHVEYRCRARKRDAERRVRHDARYGVAA